MKDKTTTLWITDKKGGKLFRTTCGTPYKDSERRNLQHHLDNAKKYPKAYTFLDLETAHIVEQEN